jgi:6-pyruvoyltetrahydropterin/6-carboxytetrahydropterin synthase
VNTEVKVCKIFTFDAAHQLVNHKGKCAHLHGHTYRLEVVLKGPLKGPDTPSDEGFVIDFGDMKTIIKETVVDRLDHAFLACGNEPALEVLRQTNSRVAMLGFRTTAENLCIWICRTLRDAGLPVCSVKLWETPNSWAEVMAEDVPDEPAYGTVGGCDCE